MIAAATVTASALAITAMPPARADQSAINFLAPYVRDAQNYGTDAPYYGLTASVVTNQPNGVVSYIGPTQLGYYSALEFKGLRSFKWDYGFSGSGSQVFNDRPWNPYTGSLDSFPFNPYAADSIGIKLDATNGSILLTLESWGNTQVLMNLYSANGVLIASGYTIGPTGGPSTVVVTVQPYYAPPPPLK